MIEAVASLLRHIGRLAIPLVIVRIFAIASELSRHFLIAPFVCVHHVATIVNLALELESLIVVFTTLSGLLALLLRLHGSLP